MDRKLAGTILGLAGVFLWFGPIVVLSENFMGSDTEFYQNGSHIGGIAYILLAAAGLYTFASWQRQHQLRLICAVVALGISLLFFFQAGAKSGWALIASLIIYAIALLMATLDKRSAARA